MEIINPEKEASFVEADFKIVKPDYHNYMLRIEKPASYEQARAYDHAINEIADESKEENKIVVFHQVGSHDMTGAQAWEFKRPNNEEGIAALIPEIHARARKIYDELG